VPNGNRLNIGVCEIPANGVTSLPVSQGVACNMGLRHSCFGTDKALCNSLKLLSNFFHREEVDLARVLIIEGAVTTIAWEKNTQLKRRKKWLD